MTDVDRVGIFRRFGGAVGGISWGYIIYKKNKWYLKVKISGLKINNKVCIIHLLKIAL